MGNMGWASRSKSARKMEARDFIWLAALGSGQREAFDLEQLSIVIDDIAGQLWTPSLEVIAGCLEEMLRGGALTQAPDKSDHYQTSNEGRQLLSLLMAQASGPVGCPLGQVGLRLKLAFLDLQAEGDRQPLLDSIIEACRNELGECERRCSICAAQGEFGQQWLRHEAERLRRDLGLLLSMQTEAPVSLVAGIA